MQADSYSFFDLFTGTKKYDIPFFQRAYVWQEENWESLLDSMRQDTGQFLGSIILINQADGIDYKLKIIDGQQRLTTLNILFRACYDVICERKDEVVSAFVKSDCNDRWFSTVIQVPFSELTVLNITEDDGNVIETTKINHSQIDRDAFKSVMFNGNDDGNNQISRAYRYFVKELMNDSPDELISLWVKFTNKQIRNKPTGCKILVGITLSDSENTQSIFDSINNTGMPLTNADTIKNALFEKISKMKGEKYAFSLYEKTWKTHFENADCIDYWFKPYKGNTKENPLEMLLYSVAILSQADHEKRPYLFDPEVHTKDQLAGWYKSILLNEQNNPDFDLERFISDLCEASEIFRNNVLNENRESYRISDSLAVLTLIFDGFKTYAFVPYVLMLCRKKKHDMISEKEFNQSCIELQKYLILTHVCNYRNKSFNRECIRLIRGTATVEKLLSETHRLDITKDLFFNGLNGHRPLKNDKAKLLLFIIEIYLRANFNTNADCYPFEGELEHIMPQAWTKKWSKVPCYDENNTLIVDKDKIIEQRKMSVFAIGNMTILSQKINNRIKEKTFPEKMEIIRPSETNHITADICYIDCKKVVRTSWDERDIYSRTKDAIYTIADIWDIHWNADGTYQPVAINNA